MQKYTKIVMATMALVILIAGCSGDPDSPEAADTAVRVTPVFSVEGLDQMSDGVVVDDLYLGIGEIRFEPLMDDTGVTYVVRNELHLHFDLESGGYTVAAEPIELPRGGEYLISIALAPNASDRGDLHGRTIRVYGQFGHLTDPEDTIGVNADEPVPLPWRQRGGVEWVSWTYATTQQADIVLNDVEFADDTDETLAIAFDVSSWVSDVHAPVSDAVEESGVLSSEIGDDEMVVDVSEDLDATGSGVQQIDSWFEARSF
jgi:hypothetical protein